MKIETMIFENNNWKNECKNSDIQNIDLVTVFGDADEFKNPKHYKFLKEKYPDASIVGCSSSGNILGSQVSQHSMVVTAISFDKATVVSHGVLVNKADDVFELSKTLARQFDKNQLKHIFLLADGLTINGSDIINGFNEVLKDTPKTGGMAGDGIRVERTFVCANDIPRENTIVAVGFYGDSLHIGNGTQGGWSGFGTSKIITKSEGNTLFEVDGESIFDYYHRYLAMTSTDLLNIGFKYPLSIKKDENDIGVIRSMLAINEDNSVLFAGDVPEGYIVQLMKPELELMIEGAGDAAKDAKKDTNNSALALLVSCAGRRAVMGDIVDEELEAVENELGRNVQLTGFYSYGELAPLKTDINSCVLHNETMTMTVIYED